MAESIDLFPSLSALLRDAMGDLLAPEATTFLDMVADDVVMEFPYAPPGAVGRLDGKAALAAYLPKVAGMITIDTLTAEAVHRGAGPDGVVVVEFAATGRGNATGLPYDQRYVSVVRARDGRIVHYRDYWNPLVVLSATGGAGAIEAALREAIDG